MVDQALDEIEGTPTSQQQAAVQAPRRRDAAFAPGRVEQRGADCDAGPGGEVEDAVGERVASRPATVLIGCSPVEVSMWCHWSTWWSTMPSMKPPSPIPSNSAGARSLTRLCEAL